MTHYDTAFYEENVAVATAAAEVVLPIVLERTEARTVVDVGCGRGAWLAVANRFGCDVHGFDFYDGPDSLLDPDEFTHRDLVAHPVDAHCDLALCLEVGEHLPQSCAADLVKGLCHADYVLWSAAIPGQVGLGHITERWPSWWTPHFATRGYVGTDWLRDLLWDDARIAPFYRQNLILFSTPSRLKALGLPRGVTDRHHPESQGEEPG